MPDPLTPGQIPGHTPAPRNEDSRSEIDRKDSSLLRRSEFDKRMEDFTGRITARRSLLLGVGIVLIMQHCMLFYFSYNSQKLGIDWKVLSALFSGMLLETYGVLREIVKFVFSEIPYNNK